MGKPDIILQSSNNVVANAKASRKQYDTLWNNAARAPMFCKITKKTMPDGKVYRVCHQPTALSLCPVGWATAASCVC